MKPSTSGSAASASGPKAAITGPGRVAGATWCSKRSASARLSPLVMDEAFGEWIGGKRKWAEARNNGAVARRGYNEVFEEWGVRDAQDMVLRDRNHPSIVMWSIGNEIDYPTDPFVHPRGRHDNSIPPD